MVFQIFYAIAPLLIVAGLYFKQDQHSQEHKFWQNQIWGIKDIAIIFTAMFIFRLFFSMGTRLISFDPTAITIYGRCVYSFFIFGCAVLVVFKRYGNFKRLGLLTNKIWLNIGYGIIAFICYWIFIGILTILFDKQEVLFNKASLLFNPEIYQWPKIRILSYILSLLVLAPIVEETVFRGLLFEPCQRKVGPIGGICLTALIWSFGHLQIQSLVFFFVLGVILCTIYWKMRSLLPGIVFHSLINFTVLSLQLFRIPGP